MVAIEVKRGCVLCEVRFETKGKFLLLSVAVLCEVRSGTMETVPIFEKLRSLYVRAEVKERVEHQHVT